MNLKNRWIRLMCAATLTCAFALPPSAQAFAPAPATQTSSAAEKPKATRTCTPEWKTKVDINRATIAELTAVPGMGVVYAKRIVANRPYHSKYGIVIRGILSRSVYNRIKGCIVAHRLKTK